MSSQQNVKINGTCWELDTDIFGCLLVWVYCSCMVGIKFCALYFVEAYFLQIFHLHNIFWGTIIIFDYSQL